MLIRIIPVSPEFVHLYNGTYFLILVGDSSCDTSDSDDDVTEMVDLKDINSVEKVLGKVSNARE